MLSKGKSMKYFRALHDHHSNGENFPNDIERGNADPFRRASTSFRMSQ